LLLTDLNSAGGIGANCLLLEMGPFSVLVDAGLHPKEIGRSALPKLEQIRDCHLDLCILTHCHLDHLGALPVFVREHPRTPVLLSHASAQLYKRLLQNSCALMERQRQEKGIQDYPLYTFSDISRVNGSVIPVTPRQTRFLHSDCGERLAVTLFPAGHIPGACGILFEHRHRRIFHTADVLFEDTPLLHGACFPEGPFDSVIIETTRGLTQRPSQSSRSSETRRLLNCIRETIGRGGSILIPAFALGRMQELIEVLYHAVEGNLIPKCPVFVSGLGTELLNIMDKIARKEKGLNASSRHLRQLKAQKLPRDHKPSRQLPAIYLLSSGMMVENTPSWSTARSLVSEHRNTIAFVGYCDPDTPGGKLLAAPHSQPFAFSSGTAAKPLLAKVEQFDLSSHADREDLVEFALDADPRAIVLTHGDPQARDWFREAIARKNSKATVIDPQPLVPTRV
jgi:Cft2 family RNA processing exonuclease